MRLFLVLIALLSGCATPPAPPSTTPEPAASPTTPEPAPPVASPQPSEPSPPPISKHENVAVAGLMETARSEAAAGKLSTAAAAIERALRIEPRNPRLWQELARVRLQQRQFEQAESVAVRSNSFAGSDAALRAENWRLISQAREARGDTQGARAALESAEKLSR